VASVTAKLYVVYPSNAYFLENLSVGYGLQRSDVCAAYAHLADPNCPAVGWSISLGPKPTGSYRLEIRVADAQGNVSFATRDFKISRFTRIKVAEDAWVNETQPFSNFGTATVLRLRSDVTGQGQHTYLKFDVPYLYDDIESATLRIHTGGVALPWLSVYLMTDSTWFEHTITWASASLQTYGWIYMGYLPANSWSSIPLSSGGSSLITGPGVFTLGLVSADMPNLVIYSKENTNTSQAAELVVEY
jgi:hypothetical protein